MCAGLVWVNIYKVNFHKMYTEVMPPQSMDIFNPQRSSGLFYGARQPRIWQAKKRDDRGDEEKIRVDSDVNNVDPPSDRVRWQVGLSRSFYEWINGELINISYVLELWSIYRFLINYPTVLGFIPISVRNKWYEE